MVRFKVVHRHVNPAYLPRVEWFKTQQEVDEFKKTISQAQVAYIESVDKLQIPDGAYEFIKDFLSERSGQFKKLNEAEQLEDIFMCYRKIKGAMEDFHDSRYAF